MTEKERIQIDARAYIDKVVAQNRDHGMGEISAEEYSRAVERAAKTAYRMVCPEDKEGEGA